MRNTKGGRICKYACLEAETLLVNSDMLMSLLNLYEEMTRVKIRRFDDSMIRGCSRYIMSATVTHKAENSEWKDADRGIPPPVSLSKTAPSWLPLCNVEMDIIGLCTLSAGWRPKVRGKWSPSLQKYCSEIWSALVWGELFWIRIHGTLHIPILTYYVLPQ